MILNLHDGSTISVAHLAPRPITCPCTGLNRDLNIKVIFANHCYTEKFDESIHSKEEILLYDAPDRPRVFCPIRHKLSLQLPDIVAGLPTKKVHQTAQQRNYVYFASIEVTNQIYEVYFMLQRAQSDDEADLRLTVESAYADDGAPALLKRPNAIRFHVLAQKVLTNQRIKFAPR